MSLAKLSSKISLAFIAIATPLISVQSALAGPRLYFAYDYMKMDAGQCVNKGYQALRNQYLQIPGNVNSEGGAIFAIGESQSVTAIIDCSDVARTGRVTVMATSRDATVNLNYPKQIIRMMKNSRQY